MLGLHAFNVNVPYVIWSKLGVGTMFIDGDLQPLGDLAQLTSAVTCTSPLVIGTNVCDPWGRLLNQNIDVIQIMRFLHLSNLYLLGLIRVVIFYLVILNEIVNNNSENLALPIFLITPVTILGIERGNEIITLLLMLSGITLFRNSKFSTEMFGSVLLSISAIFKLWPIIFVVVFLILMRKNLHKITICILLTPMVYWMVNIESAKTAVTSTQSGSPFGVSFGAKLMISSQLTLSWIIEYCIYTIITLWLMIILHRRDLSTKERYSFTLLESSVVISSVFSYSIVWLGGDSFVYRMLSLLPAVLIMARSNPRLKENCSVFVALIITSSLTSRLQISISITSALALFSLYFVWGNFSKVPMTKLRSISMTFPRNFRRYIH